MTHLSSTESSSFVQLYGLSSSSVPLLHPWNNTVLSQDNTGSWSVHHLIFSASIGVPWRVSIMKTISPGGATLGWLLKWKAAAQAVSIDLMLSWLVADCIIIRGSLLMPLQGQDVIRKRGVAMAYGQSRSWIFYPVDIGWISSHQNNHKSLLFQLCILPFVWAEWSRRKATTFSVPSSVCCDNTAPTPYGDASHDRVNPFSGLEWASKQGTANCILAARKASSWGEFHDHLFLLLLEQLVEER